MLTVKPLYYDKFICLADKCPFTCCREWKIEVDDSTYNKWTKLKDIKTPMVTTDEYSLCEYTCVSEDGDMKIRLDENNICPLLNEQGLCRVVLAYGEECISKTCHTFPREEHIFDSRIEKTLALGCPYVFDLLLAEEWRTVSEGKAEQQGDEYEEFLLDIRDKIIELLNDYELPIALKMAYYILSELLIQEEQNDGNNNYSDWDSIWSKESLDELAKAIKKVKCNPEDVIYEQNELLLDISDNYVKKNMYKEILHTIVEIAQNYEETDTKCWNDSRFEFENVWMENGDLIKKLIQEEVYSTLLMPEGDLYSMVMKMQWIGIFYAVLKQSLFIWWRKNGRLELNSIRMITNVLIRMTGYSEADIEEYLENCFEDIIWEFGYFNQII